MDTVAFEQLVVEVLDSLPDEFARHLENVEIIIEQKPTREQCRTLGLKSGQILYGSYEGVPLTGRYSLAPYLPAVIRIFQEPLVRNFSDRTVLREQVRRTVLHELAHHFGISDERLHELGAY